MKVELIKFYKVKSKNKRLFGTCHVRLMDFYIDVRGIEILKKNNNLFIKIPHKIAYDEVAKKKVSYPVFHFENRVVHEQFLNTIKFLLQDYLKVN